MCPSTTFPPQSPMQTVLELNMNLQCDKPPNNCQSSMQWNYNYLRREHCPFACHRSILGSEGIVTVILRLSTRQGEQSASHTGHFTPWARALVPTKQEAMWAPELVWPVLEMRFISCHCLESKHDSQAVQLTVWSYIDCTILNPSNLVLTYVADKRKAMHGLLNFL